MPDLPVAYVTPWFWEIVDGAKFNMNALMDHLGAMSDSEVIEFKYQFLQAEEWATLTWSEEYQPYLPWEGDDMGMDFAVWLVCLGREVWEAVQNDPSAVEPYATLFWEGNEDTLPVWKWNGEPCGSPDSHATDILLGRGISDDQIYNLLEARKQAGPSPMP